MCGCLETFATLEMADHVLGDGGLGDVDTEFLKFPVNNYVTTGGDAWKHRGIGLVLCGLVFSTALFTTSLDRRLLNVFLWSLIVSGMYAMSAFSFLLASLRL